MNPLIAARQGYLLPRPPSWMVQHPDQQQPIPGDATNAAGHFHSVLLAALLAHHQQQAAAEAQGTIPLPPHPAAAAAEGLARPLDPAIAARFTPHPAPGLRGLAQMIAARLAARAEAMRLAQHPAFAVGPANSVAAELAARMPHARSIGRFAY